MNVWCPTCQANRSHEHIEPDERERPTCADCGSALTTRGQTARSTVPL